MDDEDAPVDETIMLTRRARRARTADAAPEQVPEPEPAPEPASADEESVDERTVVVDERTVVLERTVVVNRRRRVDAAVPAPTLETVEATLPAPPPRRVDEEAAPAIYKPRPAPLVPSRPPEASGSNAPTRNVDATLTSVVRRGRQLSVFALASVGAACVISVVGLVALGFVVFG